MDFDMRIVHTAMDACRDNTFKLRMLNVCLRIFPCVHFLCYCYLDKHPSLCEQFSRYQSPDEGY